MLHDDGLARFAKGVEVALKEKKASAYSASVNSVVYFAFLPWALLDPEARYLRRDTLSWRTSSSLSCGNMLALKLASLSS